MTSPVSHHPDGHPDPDLDPDLHPPASHRPQPQQSYQPRQPPEVEAKNLSPPSKPDSPQITTTLHLPTSRQFLTSLITAISNIPLLDEPPTQQKPKENPQSTPGPQPRSETETGRRKQLLQILKEEGEGIGTEHVAKKKNGGGGNVNPLKLVPPEYRHLIITLHVLFPGVVLPGLEVLERGLVERVILRCAASSGPFAAGKAVKKKEEDVLMCDVNENVSQDLNKQQDENNKPEPEAKPNKPSGERQLKERRPPPQFFLVRSSQFLNNIHPRRSGKRKKPTSNLGPRGSDADIEGVGEGDQDRDRHRIQQQQRYLVSLEAWNCTCAAFAFACCISDMDNENEGAVTTSTTILSGQEEKEGEERQRVRDKLGTAGWTFGGMTLFDAGNHSSVPPVCKHLLACLLADKWRGALGRYVTERVVSREEMAGVVADV